MHEVREILEALSAGKINVNEAEEKLKRLELRKIGSLAVIDPGREHRSGIPEVVMAETKTSEQLAKIIQGMLEAKKFVLTTRASEAQVEYLEDYLKDFEFDVRGGNNHITLLIHHPDWKPKRRGGTIAVITAGTSDEFFAEEAEAVAEVMGVEVLRFRDVGVAGIHRLIEPLEQIREKGVDAIVVFAGMEGALPTVVASLVDIPVIGVPVPIGYGHGGNGETALSSMLQSCAPGLAVVNIGNGLGGGGIAALIALRASYE
ncbi:MAG: nickel pincer cofactor biosynthesis protein LarB [Candidatus Lokiarchaeota archaeon]|nr:nickel pincer cofactor biosynthesis protein LarB [Candidatus Lokiarchaeota archaeon]